MMMNYGRICNQSMSCCRILPNMKHFNRQTIITSIRNLSKLTPNKLYTVNSRYNLNALREHDVLMASMAVCGVCMINNYTQLYLIQLTNYGILNRKEVQWNQLIHDIIPTGQVKRVITPLSTNEKYVIVHLRSTTPFHHEELLVHVPNEEMSELTTTLNAAAEAIATAHHASRLKTFEVKSMTDERRYQVGKWLPVMLCIYTALIIIESVAFI